MGTYKQTTVPLTNGVGVRKFSVEHAERLLRMKNGGGWSLPDGSNFEFVDNGINVRRNPESGTRTEEKAHNTKSGRPSKPCKVSRANNDNPKYGETVDGLSGVGGKNNTTR